MEIKVGDVVRLKSGGPDMTVEAIEDDQYVSCVWFQGNNVLRNTFGAPLLLKPSPKAAIGMMVV